MLNNLSADLVSTLAGLKMDDFAHFRSRKVRTLSARHTLLRLLSSETGYSFSSQSRLVALEAGTGPLRLGSSHLQRTLSMLSIKRNVRRAETQE